MTSHTRLFLTACLLGMSAASVCTGAEKKAVAKEGAAPATPASAPQIAQVEPRIWSCEFKSAALSGVAMRFLVVLPPGAELTSAPLPVLYFLHGRGRHERTLLENPLTRERVLAAKCAVVLPRGRDGWYVNSPVTPTDRYADYVDEVIALAEKHFPVSRTAAQRALGGWSMGGYGAMYTACRRPADFAAVASLIGILDFPRPQIAEEGQNYAVPPRFGTDPQFWRTVDPRLLLPRLQALPLFVAYADHAAERQMNEAFLADAKALKMSVEIMRLSGGHTFPMVEQSLPAAFDFLESKILKTVASP
ncbi:alpha/beta hydrolase [Prosthecobacter sp.]|uniref:alpha/beta hydrolase n=1 Tax=Prosthecobacter sp. TaxID=1965333 RepID=UPI003783C58E